MDGASWADPGSDNDSDDDSVVGDGFDGGEDDGSDGAARTPHGSASAELHDYIKRFELPGGGVTAA